MIRTGREVFPADSDALKRNQTVAIVVKRKTTATYIETPSII
jgi:hypothetical protein